MDKLLNRIKTVASYIEAEKQKLDNNKVEIYSERWGN